MHQILLLYPDLRSRGVPYSEEHVRRLYNAGKFPKPVKLGDHVNARKAWVESEIVEWVKSRIAARDAEADVA